MFSSRRLIVALLWTGLLNGASAQQRPNIVWITCEDMSPRLGIYGESVAKTPNLDALGRDAIRFTNAYTTAGVCAPSRATIITGMYQTFTGAQHMRVTRAASSAHLYPANFVEYQAVPPPYIKAFPEYLRAAGYYCTNNAKTDYQFQAPPTVWDESSGTAHYRNRREKDQPFFAVFNIMDTHEGQVNRLNPAELLVNPGDVVVPPYYPDTKAVRDNIARFLTNVTRMDRAAGRIIRELKEAGLYDNTIIFFFSDHGDALPYVKREILKRGIHVPLLVKMPANSSAKTRNTADDRLISFVDLAPTVLSLAGIPIPEHLHGKPFLGPRATPAGHRYIYAARDRMDADYDMIRSVHDGRYQLIKNYHPNLPRYQNNQYRIDQQPMMAEILQMRKSGKLPPNALRWFESKSEYELYDLKNDPYEFNDLTKNPAHAGKLKELQHAISEWQERCDPYARIPEREMVEKWWQGKTTMPETAKPVIRIREGMVSITCQTEGASIGYRFSDNEAWKVYTGPFRWDGKGSVKAVAHRIGYKGSETDS